MSVQAEFLRPLFSAIFLRLLLGALCILFAYELGRAWIRYRHGSGTRSGLLSWVLRTIVTLLGVMWLHATDFLSIAVFALAAVSFAAGFHLGGRAPKAEHLEDVMFPKE